MYHNSQLTATTTALGDVLALLDINLAVLVTGRSLVPVLLTNLGGHSHEGLLNVGISLGRGFKERDAKLISESLGSLVVNATAVSLITLVANEKLSNVRTGIAVNLREPDLDVVEGLSLGNVVNDDNTMSTAVVGGSNRAETILTSSVPGVEI
jgi:hypothetical protein